MCAASAALRCAGLRSATAARRAIAVVRVTAMLSDCIQEYDKKIEKLAREKYGHTALLRQVKGVGPITALAYVLTLENPKRFVKSRDVGPYLGLVPRQEDSGESQPQLGISKAGDTMVRKLLVGSAQYILGPFGPDTDLRRYGVRLCERGGKNAKKRAAVAVARKLAVLLHCLWVSGEVYEPLRHGMARRPRPQRLRRRKQKHRKRENDLKIWFRKEQNAQTGVDGAGTRANPEGFGRQRHPPPCSGDCVLSAGLFKISR